MAKSIIIVMKLCDIILVYNYDKNCNQGGNIENLETNQQFSVWQTQQHKTMQSKNLKF